jgi:hypothetical protein
MMASGYATYSMLALFSLDSHQRVMVFLNMDVEKMFGGEVLAAFEAPVSMRLVVVHLVFIVGSEG